MLTLTDARTGRPGEVTAGRRGLLAVRVALACRGAAAGPGDLRALVVADVLRRVVEATGRQVVHAVDRPDPPDGPGADLDRAAGDLGVAPPSAAWPRSVTAPDVWVVADGAEPPAPADGVQLLTAGVRDWAPTPGPADPTALRLALLRRRHTEAVPLGPDRLAGAARTLAGWRRAVAGWSREPSRTPPGEIRATAHAALARDLDTPAVLDLLHLVADAPGLAPGGRFEVFAHLDRFLALELTREVGGG